MFAVNLSSDGRSRRKPGARGDQRRVSSEHLWRKFFAFFLFAFSALAQSSDSLLPGSKPADVSPEWKVSIGDYETAIGTVIVFERGGSLFISGNPIGEIPLSQRGKNEYGARASVELGFSIAVGTAVLREGQRNEIIDRNRLDYAPHPHATAASEVEGLRKIALGSAPPEEKGPFRKPDLVEVATLDPAIHLDIRYATTNDFLGAPVYTQARAFLQRPAAEALVRVLHKLQPLGYGLLIHDGYRPWYVTKIFWDVTPAEGKIFVADPAQGSRHNRGCAVDLTLYDLKTGNPIEMTGAYDEMSPRSFPNYPGGTTIQRWHRDLLRRAMESEGFTVYEAEWWHFDYKDWHEYGILNVPFEKLGIGSSQK